MELRKLFFDAFSGRKKAEIDEIFVTGRNYENDKVAGLLASVEPATLSPYDIETKLGDNLWSLSDKAFLYFYRLFSQPLFYLMSLSVFSRLGFWLNSQNPVLLITANCLKI